MLDINVYEFGGKVIVEIPNVRVKFEDKEQANEFVIELLKQTGRIGY